MLVKYSQFTLWYVKKTKMYFMRILFKFQCYNLWKAKIVGLKFYSTSYLNKFVRIIDI